MKPTKLSVNSGERVVVNVRNTGQLDHDLQFSNEVKTKMLKAGEAQTLDLGVITTSLTGFCTVAGHKDAGMTFTLDVVGGSPVVAAAVEPATQAASAAQSGAASRSHPVRPASSVRAHS